MIIKSVRIENYKSFYDSGEVEFMPGFNVVVGQNNVGKTALLEGIALRLNGGPHRSLRTIPTISQPIDQKRKVTITLYFERDELIDLTRINSDIFIPTENQPSEIAIRKFNESVKEGLGFSFHFVDGHIDLANILNYGIFARLEPAMSGPRVPIRYDLGQQRFEHVGNHQSNKHIVDVLPTLYRTRLYMFTSERLKVSESSSDPTESLNSDASNLAQVLHTLANNNERRFDRFKILVRRVFPEITHIDVPNIGSSRVRIRIWTIDPDTERSDLAMDLADCGTGIGQVLAMLYVVVNSDEPRIIVIDEPQSFLHPGAIRKLIEIFKEYPRHQYIMSSHSPTVVTAANPEKIIMVTKQEAESKVTVVDARETRSLQMFLSEVGARLSDIFGADNILWVEGSTEEQCFPMIVSKLIKKPLLGTVILGVTATGDLEGKHAKTVFEIYDKLCKGKGILPPAIGFIFDREGRSDTEQKDLARQSKGTVSFLGRRLYENYLLDPTAIAEVLNKDLETPVAADEIEAWIEEAKPNKIFLKDWRGGKADWIVQVHGAKLLIELFKHFSESKIPYSKTEHGVALTQWIIENSPSDLDEVVELINKHCFSNAASS